MRREEIDRQRKEACVSKSKSSPVNKKSESEMGRTMGGGGREEGRQDSKRFTYSPLWMDGWDVYLFPAGKRKEGRCFCKMQMHATRAVTTVVFLGSDRSGRHRPSSDDRMNLARRRASRQGGTYVIVPVRSFPGAEGSTYQGIIPCTYNIYKQSLPPFLFPFPFSLAMQ